MQILQRLTDFNRLLSDYDKTDDMLNIRTEYRVNQKHFSQLETGPMWIIMIKEGKTDVEYEIIMSCKLCIKERNNPWRITCFFNNWTNLAHKEIPSVWRRMTRQDFIIRWLMVCTALLNDKNCWVTAAD